MQPPVGQFANRSIISDEREAAFIKALRDGAHLTTACKLVQLPGKTYRNYRTYAQKGDEPWASFIEKADVAEAEGELFHIRTLKAGAEGTAKADQWRASAEFLKRRHGDRWNRGWSPVEADAPDEGLGSVTDMLADEKKTSRAADLVEQYVNGTNSQPARSGSVVPGWLRSDSEPSEMEAAPAPGSPKPRAARGRKRKDATPDSGDASASRQVGADL